MPHPIDVKVGERIRRYRLLAGMNQETLGVNVGVKFQQIQKYEMGTNRVSASRLWEIAKTLNVPISVFFEEKALLEKKT